MIAGLLEVDCTTGDTYETLELRLCAGCGDSVLADLPATFRTFYLDPETRESVCEHCVEWHLSGKDGD